MCILYGIYYDHGILEHTQCFDTRGYWWETGPPLRWRHNGDDSVSNHQPQSVYSTVYSGADQSKHQSSASLAFVWGIHRGPVNSPHKWPVTRKMFPFDDVIMVSTRYAIRRLIKTSLEVSKPRDRSFKLSHRFAILLAHQQLGCHCACQMPERLDNSK